MSKVLPHNPEFRRTFKLGFSATRLLIDPFLIGLALASVVYTERHNIDLWVIIFYAAQAGFFFFTVLWGSYQASQSLVREFSAGTWDTQRMSALGPWQMVWGKLFGATFHVWYDGAFLLLLIFISSLGMEEITDSLLIVLAWAAFAVMVHAISMMLSLSPRAKNLPATGVLGLLLCLLLTAPSLALRDSQTCVWLGLEMKRPTFALLSLLALCGWSLVGLWQAMRRELFERNTPWWWLGFLLFWLLWSMGLLSPARPVIEWIDYLSYTALLAWVSVYVQLLLAPKDPATGQQIFIAWQRRDKVRILHRLPNYLVSVLFAFALSLITGLVNYLAFKNGTIPLRELAFTPLLFAPFVIRDLACVLWFHLTPNIKNPLGVTFVAFLVLYALCHALFRGSPLYFAFVPLPLYPRILEITVPQLAVGILLPVAQAILAVWLLHGCWQKHWAGTPRRTP
ncbi:hypothetical protein AGMMS50225_11550 [Betaproteobacteria bacterium]|nr:hypothetical protein AGMMS50225_11550 [Betaproteobacteria bacterium]